MFGVTLLLVTFNIILFVAKLIVGWKYNSIAILSDAGNSLVDIVTSIIILFAVRVAAKPADADHQFGHGRAEPLAAFTVAVLTFVLAFEVAKESVMRIFSGTLPERGIAPVIVLLAVIFVKSLMWFLSRRSVRANGSPALAAVAADSKMDIVISSVALVGVGATEFGYGQLDAWAALLIAFWIAWIGWSIARENLDRLLGARPDTTTMRKIHGILNQLVKQKKIKSVRELRAQLLGSDVYIYVNVLAHKSLSSKKYHDLEEKIQQELGKVAKVERVSVHVDLI